MARISGAEVDKEDEQGQWSVSGDSAKIQRLPAYVI